ncbi:MAG: prepilin-type N-terminal cleavage/methylation domain-containing protein [Planctomycetes bacterium]|nr:prepilin-type N-terminal cleavage/methylation domain-containing protein [Planctomycetota bacterium]
MKRKHGFTLVELLVVMAIISLLIGLLLPALAKARAQAMLTKDSAQIKEIHQSWVVFSRELRGALPTPGLIDRLKDPILDEEIPGRGPEDYEANWTGPLFSVCIMRHYFTPQLAIAPSEPSGNVLSMDNYNYDAYQPLGANIDCPDDPATPHSDSYWDCKFDVTLFGTCNTSYAHMPIAGERKKRHWRDTLDSTMGMLGTRGVKDGDYLAEAQYYRSITLEFHGGHKEWVGLVAFNDNHVERLDTFLPQHLNYHTVAADGTSTPHADNIFNDDTGDGMGGSGPNDEGGFDIWLVIYKEINDDPVNPEISLIQWD